MKKEKFSIGETVFLVHLAEEATVTRVINDDLIYVDAQGIEIPVFTSDVNHLLAEKKEEPKQETKYQSVTPPQKTFAEKQVHTNAGIFLAFEPVKINSGDISSFNIFLVNDSATALSFNYSFFIRDKIHFVLKKPVGSYSFMLLHSIEFDLLNEMLSFQLDITDAQSGRLSGEIIQKVRPQNFFNKLYLTPLLQRETYQYKVPTKQVKQQIEEKKKPITFDAGALKQMMMDVPVMKDNEIGSPVIEIDLHIEALANDHRTLNSSEMMQVQLRAFQQALERAISHHAERLYVIHGVGTGKLRNEIHRMLRDYHEVRSYNNNFHTLYGYGATEIILR